MGIVRFALRFPHTFYVLAALILFLGAAAIRTMPSDIFPEIRIPVVSVIWSYTGLSTPEMVCASKLAGRRGLIPADVTDRQVELLKRFDLPTERRPEWDVDALLAVMRRDKKNVAGRLRFILPTRLGHVAAFDDVAESQVREVLAAP